MVPLSPGERQRAPLGARRRRRRRAVAPRCTSSRHLQDRDLWVERRSPSRRQARRHPSAPFVTERWRIVEPNDPLGLAALAISAPSATLHDWAQGVPIALHGINEPASIGRATSHGCIRVDDTVIRRLFRYALLGTPVVIES
jgi:lipoprotein-anchoring transpeptidase ErfK/SrfK